MLACFFVFVSQTSAQSIIREQDRQIRDRETRELEVTEKVPVEKLDFILEYGAWVFADYRNYKNLDNDRELEDWIKDRYTIDTRVWGSGTYYQLLMLYGRLKNVYTWLPNVSSDYTGIKDDFEGPVVDVLYGLVFLHDRYNIPLSLKVGRQFLTLGSGIAYSDIHDGIELGYIPGRGFGIRGFISKTKEFDDNIDISVPGYKDENRRFFFAVEAHYAAVHDVAFAYVLVQRDRSHECPTDPTQNYTYNSEYLGLGIAGERPLFAYWAEGIKEFGKSYTDASRTELAVKDVDAWAFDVGAKLTPDFYSHPILEAEIAYGSGDKDRISVTDTVGGNINGRDTNFLYFGIFDAGYTMAPRLSNLFIYRIGLSLKPLEFIPYVGNNFAVGSRIYVYQKAQKEGGIYDVEASEPSPDVGEELDFFVHWKVYENLYFTLRYGVFFPGAAYPRGIREKSKFLYVQTRMTF